MNKLTLSMFKAVKVTKNIRRLFRDIRRRVRRQDTSDQVNRLTLMVTVTEREQFLQSELLKQLQKIPGNRRQLSAFIHEELNREDNCTHFLIIEGVNLPAASCGASCVIPDLIGNPVLDPRFRGDDRRTVASREELLLRSILKRD